MRSSKCIWLLVIDYSLLFANVISANKFTVEFQWRYINFTWPSGPTYQNAITSETYIPENNAMAGIKIYKDRLYFALPRLRPGVPVTLASIPISSSSKIGPLLEPFPNWKMNDWSDCSALHSVHSMEIDPQGVMWVLDGMRTNNNTKCPPKLVLFDLKKKVKILHTYVFPNHICLQDGGYLNDIVIDETEGIYIYITDFSSIHPGLIVYSKQQDKAWKLRDRSMFAELNAAHYTVENLEFKKLSPIDGLALSPFPEEGNDERFVFYTQLVGFSLYSISTRILKNEELCKADTWRQNVTLIGRKQSQSDGMICDNIGNLYYTLLPLYGVGVWDIETPFNESSRILDQNNETLVWPDSFSFDGKGNLYLLSDNINKFIDLSVKLEITDKILFHVTKMHTFTQSYMFK